MPPPREVPFVTMMAPMPWTPEQTTPRAAAIRTRSDDDARVELLGIRGFGDWSVEMFLIFPLNRTDIYAVWDAGLRRAICELYGIPLARHESRVGELSARWRPFRCYACRCLWGWLDVASKA